MLARLRRAVGAVRRTAAQMLAAGTDNPALAALLPPRAETAVHRSRSRMRGA